RLEATLDNTTGSGELHREVTTRLQTLLSRWLRGAPGAAGTSTGTATDRPAGRRAVAGRLEEASADEVLDFINKELGAS
ncbi:hypothetical protein ACFV3R_34370, partial [Streptomyces sp. NPDC059740]|uniref:hypothetical protein n=1 Tax=Streptomyces sp. NPDC059740 TaxID=3346926 RepID=UPI003655BC2E